MNAGDLRHRITIKNRTEIDDGHLGLTETWTAVRERISARVQPLDGRDLERARQIDPRAKYEVTMRFWQAYPTHLDGGRAQIIWHDGNIGDRTLEMVEPPREVEHRVTLAFFCGEQA